MNKTAGVAARVGAAVIDSLIGSALFFVPVLGGLYGIFYMLSRDALIYKLTGYEEWRSRSIGKKLMNLRIEKEDGSSVDMKTSVRRNLTLIPGRVVGVIPVLGWVLGPLLGTIVKGIELFILTSDPEGIRLGDRLAGTKVIKTSKRR